MQAFSNFNFPKYENCINIYLIFLSLWPLFAIFSQVALVIKFIETFIGNLGSKIHS